MRVRAGLAKGRFDSTLTDSVRRSSELTTTSPQRPRDSARTTRRGQTSEGRSRPLGTESPAVPLVQAEGLDFSYGSLQILFGIDLTVHEGEILALLGTNGAGKSTLLRVLCGLEEPSSGQIRIGGSVCTGARVVEMVNRGVVMVPGGKAVFSDMTVEENLDAGGYRLRHDPSIFRERRAEALNLFPQLRERLNQRAATLSGGEQQQLALAKAFLLRPRVLLIDELSLGLAPVTVEVLMSAVRALNEAGSTIVLVEQSLNVASSLCQRAIFLEKGAVRFEGPTADLLERSDVARAVFLGAASASEDRRTGSKPVSPNDPDASVLALALSKGRGNQ